MAKQTHPNKILLVEDEDSLAAGLEFNLSEEGYQLTRAKDGREAQKLLKTHQYDLIILDIMLPHVDGFELAEQIRQQSVQIPILFLTARTGVQDRLRGLELGADDYLTKPFHLKELLLRVEGMLRRKAWYRHIPDEQKQYTINNLTVDFDTLMVTGNKQEFRLTEREAMVLQYLIINKGKIVSRGELLQNVWSMPFEIDTRTVDNFIVRLRKYFEPNPKSPQYIKSVRSAGYIFDVPES